MAWQAFFPGKSPFFALGAAAGARETIYQAACLGLRKKKADSEHIRGLFMPGSHYRPNHIEEPGSPECSSSWGTSAVIQELDRLADRFGCRLGLNRREFLKSQMGLAASFLVLNAVFGDFFSVDPDEASEPGAGDQRIEPLSRQFIFDVQVHYVHDNYPSPGGLLPLWRAADRWSSAAGQEQYTIRDLQFESFYRQIFQDSQTSVALLSNAPNDDTQAWFLSADNVYAVLGAVFAATCSSTPELCAGILGRLIQGMGEDRVCWGTDSVWFGSPQWQIEALRRFEIPQKLRREHGYAPLGPADGRVKRKILGEKSARLCGLDPKEYVT
jgi:hypothetical protein